MARLRPKQEQELPDPSGRQRCRFPAQWDELSSEELQHRHEQARLLRAKGYGAVRLLGSSSHGLFDD